jgi:hypothetical protein
MVQFMQVLRAAIKALDDKKRAVRQEAVRCRQTWYENYILLGVGNLALWALSSYFPVGNRHLLRGAFSCNEIVVWELTGHIMLVVSIEVHIGVSCLHRLVVSSLSSRKTL